MAEPSSLRRAKVLLSHLTDQNASSEAIAALLVGQGCSAQSYSSLNEEMQTLAKEREQAFFDVKKLSELLYGEEEVKIWNDVALGLERDPILNDGMSRYDMSRPEERIRCTQKFFRVCDILNTKNEEKDKAWLTVFTRLIEQFDPSLGMRLFVHYKLWIPTILNQGTPEQQKKWVYDNGSFQLKVIGCFAMTELGFSSHLRGAETIATFDEDTDEIAINSTSIKATKWWIGLAGQIATHTIVFANLQSKGKACGIQLFIVPIRDPKTGITYPGVSIGDLGPKAGRNGLDNGWLQFTNVRVPRENMLARWAQLSRSGEFTPPPNLALAYGSTITERVGSASGAALYADPCLTVAVRYSAVRRQGPKNPQILDYQTHQQLLIPNLAFSYAVHFTCQRLNTAYLEALDLLRSGNNAAYLKALPDLHGTSCGMKVVCTWWGADAIEASRRALGGHGFHAFSSIPLRSASYGVLTTGGGDNYVLSQQCAGYLLKIFQDTLAGKKPKGDSVQYLAQLSSARLSQPLSVSSPDDLLNLPTLLNAFRHVAVRLLEETAGKLQDSVSTGLKLRQAFNDHLVAFVDLVQAHIHYYILESFVHTVNTNTSNEGIHRILTQLCLLFALSTMNKYATYFLEDGTLPLSALPHLRKAIVVLSQQVRQVAVPLVDAFAIPDFVLLSPLGKYDGNIYHAYLEAVKNARGGSDIAAPYWDQLVKPRVYNA